MNVFEQYRLLVENAHDGIFIVQDERIRFANPAARRYLGLDGDSVLDVPLEAFIHPEDRERVMRIMEAGNRARSLIGQILTFSRQQKEEQRPVAMGMIVKEVLKMLRVSTPATIEFVESIEEESGIVMADPTRIHQLIMNLCTNAAHAMKEGGGKLAISLKPILLDDALERKDIDLPPGSYVRLK